MNDIYFLPFILGFAVGVIIVVLALIIAFALVDKLTYYSHSAEVSHEGFDENWRPLCPPENIKNKAGKCKNDG